MNINDIDLKIQQFYNDFKSVPFVWGKSDCACFASEWVKRLTGRDIISQIPSYSSETEACKVLFNLGLSGQEDLLDDYYIRTNKRNLKRGDLVGHYFGDDKIMSIGVYTGMSAMFKSHKGVQVIQYVNLDDAFCWSVK